MIDMNFNYGGACMGWLGFIFIKNCYQNVYVDLILFLPRIFLNLLFFHSNFFWWFSYHKIYLILVRFRLMVDYKAIAWSQKFHVIQENCILLRNFKFIVMAIRVDMISNFYHTEKEFFRSLILHLHCWEKWFHN